jgi:Zn-dependent peptidase ImmA (M78 family)
MNQHDHAFRVPPRSTENIREGALYIRQALNITTPFFPLKDVVEKVLPRMFEEYVFDVRDKAGMVNDYGKGTMAMTTPAIALLEVREDVYEELCANDGRARFTVAHELGHLFLHQDTGGFARFSRDTAMKIYESSEWQADNFAAELLMPLDFAVNCGGIESIMAMFGVSYTAAEIRWKLVKKLQAQKKETPSGNSGILR